MSKETIFKVVAAVIITGIALYIIYHVVDSFGVEYTEPEVMQTEQV